MVFESGRRAGAFTREEWFGDADLCAVGTWSRGVEMVDSGGAVFHIGHCASAVSNDLVATAQRMPADTFIAQVERGLTGSDARLHANAIHGCNADEVFAKSIEWLIEWELAAEQKDLRHGRKIAWLLAAIIAALLVTGVVAALLS